MLERSRGRGTELVTLYVPSGRQISSMSRILRDEQGTASNIKSDQTRKHVVESIGKIISRLNSIKRTPPNGLVMFVGAVVPEGGCQQGAEKIMSWEFEPPKKLSQYLYRCDDHFHTDILKDMYMDEDIIGFLALDTKDAGWGLLYGDRLETVGQTGSGVAGKHRQGGQSAKRFQKLREMHLADFYTRVASITRKHFLDDRKVKGIIVSGPGHTKNEFVDGKWLEYRLKQIVVGSLDTSYAGADGVREAFEKSGELLDGRKLANDKKLVDKVLAGVNTGLTGYGLVDSERALTDGSAHTVILSDSVGLSRLEAKCMCGNLTVETVSTTESIRIQSETERSACQKCGLQNISVVKTDIIEHFALLAAKCGAKAEVVSGSAEYGKIISNLGGMAVLLKYKKNY